VHKPYGKTAVLTDQNSKAFAGGITYLLDNPDIAKK
jgi:hypothetical protein